MYTAEAVRGRGIGRAILLHIINEARRMGMGQLSLETGAWPYFHPARELYRCHGFRECAPFEGYTEDPNSVFMTRGVEQDTPRRL